VGGCAFGYAFGAGEEVTNWIANFILGGAAMSDDPHTKTWGNGYRSGYGHGMYHGVLLVVGFVVVVVALS
jgi:hypothetical protein